MSRAELKTTNCWKSSASPPISKPKTRIRSARSGPSHCRVGSCVRPDDTCQHTGSSGSDQKLTNTLAPCPGSTLNATHRNLPAALPAFHVQAAAIHDRSIRSSCACSSARESGRTAARRMTPLMTASLPTVRGARMTPLLADFLPILRVCKSALTGVVPLSVRRICIDPDRTASQTIPSCGTNMTNGAGRLQPRADREKDLRPSRRLREGLLATSSTGWAPRHDRMFVPSRDECCATTVISCCEQSPPRLLERQRRTP